MKNFVSAVLAMALFCSQAVAGLPPTTIKGQTETSAKVNFGTQVPYNQRSGISGTSNLVETGNENLLLNPNMEDVVNGAGAGWPVGTGVVEALETSVVRQGKYSMKLTLTGASGEVIHQYPTYTIDLSGQNIEDSMYVNTTLAGIKVCGITGGVQLQCSAAHPGDGKWHKLYISNSGTTSMGLQLYSTNTVSGIVYVDEGYFGEDRNIGSVAQAVLYGQVKITGCAGGWSTSSASYTAFSAQTSCSYATSGNASAPSTMIPGITFSSLPPGNYVVKYEGTIGAAYVSGAGAAHFKFNDGTNDANEISYVGPATSGGDAFVSGINQTFSYSTAQSNVTFQIKAQSENTGALAYVYGQTTFPGVISVYYFPSTSQQIVAQNNSADVMGMTFWTAASTCPAGSIAADGSAVSRSTYAALFNRISTTYGTGDGSTTFNVPDVRGIFIKGDGTNGILSNASGSAFSGTLGAYSNDAIQGHYHNRLVSGDNTFDLDTTTPGSFTYTAGGNSLSSGTSTGAPVSDGTNGTPRAGHDTHPANVGMHGCIYYVSNPAPLLVGSVTSATAGSERIERATVNTTCTSSPCTITSQSGSWISTITRTSTGVYVVTFSGTPFSAAPTCNVTSTIAQLFFASMPTTSGFSFDTYGVGSSTPLDSAFNFICMGPR